MKPDWKDAPEWAQWLAMDGDGQWFWHQYEPRHTHEEWWDGGRAILASESAQNWLTTLEGRPS